MRPAHPLEQAVGIEHYASDADGTGGRLRESPGDFRVEELEAFGTVPVDADPGSYPNVVCRVALRGWDTNDFAGRLSDALGISRERVSWAGTKDKHAVTTQLFTVRKVDPGRLRSLSIRDADLSVVGRAGRPISFGDLAGNRFEVTAREPERPDAAPAVTRELHAFLGDVEAPVADGPEGSVAVAVPNYFGHQRFGSRRPVTGEVGLAIVRREWREAVRLYAGNPSDAEPAESREARAFVDEQFGSAEPDWTACLERLPDRLGFERAMIGRLAEGGGGRPAGSGGTGVPAPDEGGVWRAALEAVPTNLQRLFVNAAQSLLFNRILGERLDRGLPFDRPVAGDGCCFADADAPPELAKPDPGRGERADARRVDTLARHCRRGRAFVTAPLVGTDTELADREPGEIERAVLDDAGVGPADFDLPGEFGSTGTRRAVTLRTELLVERDPLRFAFALPSGGYATTLLREYLKTSPLEM